MSTTPSPIERLGLWVAANAGLPDDLSHVDADALIDALGNSSVPDAIADASSSPEGVPGVPGS